MKKVTKNAKTKEPIKLNKLNIGINISCLILLLIFIVNNIVLYYNDFYAYFFVSKILNNINGLFYFLNGHINYLSIIIFVLYFIFIIAYVIVIIYYENISKKTYESRSKIINIFYTILITYSLLIILPSALSQFANHLPHFDSLYFKETKNKTYEVEDLIELDKFLQQKVMSMSKEIKRDDYGNIKSIDYNKQAVKNLKNISNKIELLKGLYPNNSSKINNLMRSFLGSKTVGFTTPYNTYFDYNKTPTSVLNTITHEFCHTKGILRESETVYCAFLAGIESDDELSRYSSYIEGFSWVSDALYDLEPNISDELEDEVLSKCLTENYKELCDVYTKNNEEYIKGAKYMRISSYRLKNYLNNQEELKDSLTILINNGAKIIVDNEERILDEILKLIKDKNESRITIELPISNKIFKNIKPAIKDGNLYLAIYQKNKKENVSKEKKKDAEKYFLGPLKDKDENIIFNTNYSSIEYEYSRVARLLLEHYEKEGYLN